MAFVSRLGALGALTIVCAACALPKHITTGQVIPGMVISAAPKVVIRGGPHPLDRFSSQLRWNPVHDSSDLGLTGTGA